MKCANTAKQNILQIKHTVKPRDVLDVGNISPGTLAIPENKCISKPAKRSRDAKNADSIVLWLVIGSFNGLVTESVVWLGIF